MRVLMRKRPTEGMTDIVIEAPDRLARRIAEAVEKMVALIQEPSWEACVDEELVAWDEAFPDGRQPGRLLAGARYRENLTQKKLAEMVGARPSHISEMENGRRPIGKEMARRLAAALNTDYRHFL